MRVLQEVENPPVSHHTTSPGVQGARAESRASRTGAERGGERGGARALKKDGGGKRSRGPPSTRKSIWPTFSVTAITKTPRAN